MKRKINKTKRNDSNNMLSVEFVVDTHENECICCNGNFKGFYCIRIGNSSYKLCDVCYHRLLAKMYRCSEQMLDLSTDNVKTGGV